MHYKEYNANQPHFMIGRQSGDHRPNVGRYRRLSADDSLIKRHRPTVWRSSADWRPMIGATFCRYHDVNSFKTSADYRPIIGRPSPDASPMTNPMKIGGSVNETFNLGASTKKSSADQKFSQNRCRRRPTIGRRRPIFQNFARKPSADRRFG